MPNVDSNLATVPGIESYLEHKPQFAARTVKRLSGGMGNFAYRIFLHEAFAGRQTLVLKYAPPYAASSGGRFPLDQKRQLIEVQGLRLAGQLWTANIPVLRSSDCQETPSAISITVPAVHFFDEEMHVIIMDDVGEDCQTLKELLIKESLPKAVAERIGTALGEFILDVHSWHQNPGIDLTEFANNQIGKYISSLVTYGRLESTLTGRDNIPTLSEPLLGIPEAKMRMISKLVGRRQQTIHAASASDPMTHGDLWPGNVVVSLRRGTNGSIEGVEKLCVLDWELSKTGLPGLDLGQFCAELYTLSKFYPAREESARTIIGSFLGTYRERRGKGEDIELARTVVSHIGAHVVTWTPRVSSWSGRQKTREVVVEGAEMLVLGEEGTELALRESIIAPLLCSSSM